MTAVHPRMPYNTPTRGYLPTAAVTERHPVVPVRPRPRKLRWRSRPWRRALWVELREIGWMLFAWACAGVIITTAILVVLALRHKLHIG